MSSAADATATFFQYLQASRLLADDQLRDLWGWIAQARPDLPALGREIVRRGWLTTYQIREVAKGRGAALTVAGRYVILDILGEGGMGRVYKVQDARMGRLVALKVIRKEKLAHPAAKDRFDQEIRALSVMDHPNVVKVYDAEEVDGYHFYVMEFIDGTDLTKIVRDRGPMPIPEACDAIRQAALGLQHAHERGLVHRDIKPSNIIVPRNGGAVKLVDLGLARLMEAPGGEEANRITQEGFVIGTPDFLAPEQARNPMGVDIRADIYALGGTLYYILTGLVPYDGASPTEKLLKHCTEPPPGLLLRRMDAPAQIEQLIHWCMAKAPEARPQTPMQLALALQPFCPAPPPGTGAFAGPASGRYPLPGAAVPSSGRHPMAPQPVPQPIPQPYPQPYPPMYAPPGAPIPLPDPAASSQLFKLPAREEPGDADKPPERRPKGRAKGRNPDDADERPDRRSRGKGKVRPPGRAAGGKFPVAAVLLAVGALFVVGVLGFGVYRALRSEPPPPPESFTNTAEMKMVRLSGGTFRMGSPDDEAGRPDDREGPVREVTVGGPFFVSATEVTHGQYVRVMGSSPSSSAKRAASPSGLPVESVTWDEANEFCRRLTEKNQGQPWARKGWAYRLPTEAEWEYACRAGTDTPFWCGAAVAFRDTAVFRAEAEGPLQQPIEGKVERLTIPAEAGRTKANPFGLHDMHGNVAEWCGDWYRPIAYRDGAADNPTGPADGDKRVVRGGAFNSPAAEVRSAARRGEFPSTRALDIGFRVVYAPAPK